MLRHALAALVRALTLSGSSSSTFEQRKNEEELARGKMGKRVSVRR
jgi:hypothetical protein